MYTLPQACDCQTERTESNLHWLSVYLSVPCVSSEKFGSLIERVETENLLPWMAF